MSDNLTRYLAISNALQQAYRQACATELCGNYRRHLNTLSAMIGGIVGSQKTRLSAIANKMPGKVQRESRIKRLSRWLSNERITNERITREAFFVPFAAAMLHKFPPGPLVLVVDGSEVGQSCVALVVSVLFGKRALPLGWLVVAGKKGHFSQENHVRIVEQVAPLLPEGRDVIFLGDGEFDGCELLGTVQKKGWRFACRTARNVVLAEQDDAFSFADLAVAPGELLSIPEVAFTAQGFGPVTAIAHWDAHYQEPLYLVTNMELADEAVYWYRKRYGIETLWHRDLLLGREESRLSFVPQPCVRSRARQPPFDRRIPGLHLDRLFGSYSLSETLAAKAHPSHAQTGSKPLSNRTRLA